MKAAYYSRFKGPVTVEQVADPAASTNGVVIKVAATGLCLSDWHGWMGHDPDILLPHVPGHELVGEIVATGKQVRKWTKGQRVTVPFVGGCGKCLYCKEGNQQVCDHQFQPGFTAWGSFAEYVAIDYADENLVELPPGLADVAAASLGCRFITAYRALADQAQVQTGQWMAVYGCGGVGLSAILIGSALGARIIAVDITDDTCALAKTLGASYTLNARKTKVVEAVREFSHGGAHVSLDALGHPETCLNSINSLRKGGKHLQLGLIPSGPVPIPMDKVIARELQLIGSHGMQANRYQAMFELIEKKNINLNALIGRTISLDAVTQLLPALRETRGPGIIVVNKF